MNIKELIDKLEYAKKAVKDMLEDEGVMVNFHDIEYWASEVKRLRGEIKKNL